MSQSRPVANTKSADGNSTGESKESGSPGAEPEPSHALHRLLSADRSSARVTASSRKRALEHGCEILACSNELNARSVLDALLARERLGTTALGEGIAIPHCRMPECTVPVGVILTLETGVDYNAPDDNDVDLLFILVVPDSETDEHLQVLSQLASILINEDNLKALRAAKDNLTLFNTMMSCSQAQQGDAAS